jgi:hypothetical protein
MFPPQRPHAKLCWVDGDYRLQLQSVCINAGDPNYEPEQNETDLGGERRVALGLIDMGAYELPNALPVADAGPDQTVYAWIDGIAEVTLYGSGSYDSDGDELTYLWRCSIDGNEVEANTVNLAIELLAGQYTFELVVNDGFEDSEPDYVTINVIGPVKASMCIAPQIIFRRCQQRNIMAVLHLPARCGQVDNNVPLVLYPGQIEATRQFVFQAITGPWIYAFFDKDDILDAISSSSTTRIYVVGQLTTGQYFYGVDTPRIINPGWRPRKWGNTRDWFHNWKWHH